LNTSVSNVSYGLTLRANISWTFVGNVINAASWFAMTIVLAKLGSPDDIGKFALGLATTAPIFMFAALRLRDVQATDAKHEFVFGDYFALRLTTTVLALLVVVGIVFAFGFHLEMALIILATSASKSIEAISDAFYGLFMKQERLDRSAKSLMLKGPLSLLGLGIGFYLTGSVFWGVMGLVIARAVIMLSYDIRNVSLSLDPASKLIGKIIPRRFPRPRWNAKTLSRLFWLSLPLGFVTMLISFNLNIPRYFIEGYMGPRLSKYYAAKNARAFRRLSLKLLGIGLLLGSAGVLVAYFAGKQILTLFYGPEYALAGLFTLLMLGAGIDYLATIVIFVITSTRSFKIQLPLHLITTSAVALACYFLIPSAGLMGAAIALIIAYLVRLGGSLAAAWYALRRLYA